MNWKQELKRLHLDYIKETSPDFFELSGGYKMHTIPYNDQTTNGLTKAVYDWLKYNGHYVNRINTQGQARVEKVSNVHERVVWTHGNTNKGTADIIAIVAGRHIAIEIKCAGTKDRIRPDQLKEKARIERAGGIYLIVTCMDEFIKWYNETHL